MKSRLINVELILQILKVHWSTEVAKNHFAPIQDINIKAIKDLHI